MANDTDLVVQHELRRDGAIDGNLSLSEYLAATVEVVDGCERFRFGPVTRRMKARRVVGVVYG